MQDISGSGLTIRLIASKTFPAGFTVSAFADDSDPFDVESVKIKDVAMDLSGGIVTYSKPMPIILTLNVVPGSESDINLQLLGEVNRTGKGKTNINDTIQIVGVWPSGRTVAYLNGVITDFIPGDSLTSAGRMKTKAYKFAFENRIVS